jgi:hypothetical protein
LYVGGDFSTYWLEATSNNTVVIAAGTNGTIQMQPFNGTINSNSTVTVPASLGSSLVPIALTSAEVTSSDSTGNPQYNDATSILCPAGEDGSDRSTWLARADTVGRITARLYTPLEVGGFRIGNTNVGGAGTETFR